MSLTKRHNAVSFLPIESGSERIWLTLEGDWVVTGGLAPNVNIASVPASEFAKFEDNVYNRVGNIEFWYANDPDSGTPDFVYNLIFLVDAAPAVVGRSPGESIDTIKVYRLSFADLRQAYVEPRGGRLMSGEGNTARVPGGTLVENSVLMDACVEAMGATVTIDATVDEIPAARNLRWFAAHAPTELGRLLQHTNHVFCFQSDGDGVITKIGSGTLPTIASDRIVSDISASVVDRRGREVLLVSSPAAQVDTWDEDASDGVPAWFYVAQDPAAGYAWTPLGSISALGDPEEAVKNGFLGLPEQHREHFRSQVYCCIQLSASDYPPSQSPILRTVITSSSLKGEPSIKLRVAVQGQDGEWKNVETRIRAQSIHADNVLVFPRRLGVVKQPGVTDPDSAVTPDFDTYFEAIDAEDLKPTFSVEAFGEGVKTYSVFGFNVVGGFFSAMSEAVARNHLKGFRPDTCIYCVPELRCVAINGTVSNYDDQQDRAEAMARQLVASEELIARTVEVKGFQKIELSGRVNAVRYSQSSVRTIVEIDGWNAAGAGSFGSEGDGGGAEQEDFTRVRPNSQTSRFSRPSQKSFAPIIRGEGGGGELFLGSMASAGEMPALTGWRDVYGVIVGPISGQFGRYTLKTISGKVNRSASGAFVTANIGTTASEVDAEFWFPWDAISGTHSLDAGQVVSGRAAVLKESGKLIVVADWAALADRSVEVTVVTDYRIDGANKKFQKKTRQVRTIPIGAESGWTDVHTGDDC